MSPQCDNNSTKIDPFHNITTFIHVTKNQQLSLKKTDKWEQFYGGGGAFNW